MTAALGAWVATGIDAPLYLDLRDIFVDTLTEILPRKVAIPLKPVFSAIERWTVRRAVHVNLVSRGFTGYFDAKYPGQSFSYHTNGIDNEFLVDTAAPPPDPGRPLTVVYAGNMGQGQGLHTIIPKLARRLTGRAQFRLIGDGGRRAQLEQSLGDLGVTNVEILPPMPRGALIEQYRAADVLFLHLNDYEAFKKVLPSKVFEYGALGKPVWAGVAGYSAQFLAEELTNVAVFPPCDDEAAMQVFERLEIRDTPRLSFVRKFSRATIMADMAADILRHAASAAAR
jgi:glycosyltransferase involved in cell wall biosynthesis